jgi:hypothetical protein
MKNDHDLIRGYLRGVVKENGNSGHLNPQWVEWLMGYPVGYTE